MKVNDVTFTREQKWLIKYYIGSCRRSSTSIEVKSTWWSNLLCLALARRLPFVVLGVHQLGEKLSGMAARVEVIRVRDSLAFAPLLTAVRGEDVLVVVVVEVLVLVDVCLGHSSRDSIYSGTVAERKSRARRKIRKVLLDWNDSTEEIDSLLVARRSPTRVYIRRPGSAGRSCVFRSKPKPCRRNKARFFAGQWRCNALSTRRDQTTIQHESNVSCFPLLIPHRKKKSKRKCFLFIQLRSTYTSRR